MRKFIKISIIILSVIFLILVGAWLVGRKQAQDAGKKPLTFREFLNLTSDRDKASGLTGNGNDLTSEFQNNGSNTGTNGNNSGNNSGTTEPSTNVSKFTGNTVTPNTSGGNGGSTGSGSVDVNHDGNVDVPVDTDGDGSYDGIDIDGDGIIDGIDIDGDGIIDLDPNGDSIDIIGLDDEDIADADEVSDEEICGERDLNIQFTPEEIQRLQELQARFYAVSQYLHNDGDVMAEKSNWSTFKTESDKITEFYDYCKETAPKIANPLLKFRIPTPFWHETAKDTKTVLPAKLVTISTGAQLNSDGFYANSYGVILGAKQDLYLSEDDPQVLIDRANGEASGNSEEINLTEFNKIFTASGANDRALRLEQTLRLNLW
jgi:type II secretory pathway pseudopilin PulG